MPSNDSDLPPTSMQLKLASYIFFLFKRLRTAAYPSSKNTADNCPVLQWAESSNTSLPLT